MNFEGRKVHNRLMKTIENEEHQFQISSSFIKALLFFLLEISNYHKMSKSRFCFAMFFVILAIFLIFLSPAREPNDGITIYPPLAQPNWPVVGGIDFVRDNRNFLISNGQSIGPVFRTFLLGQNIVIFHGEKALSRYFYNESFISRFNAQPQFMDVLFPQSIGTMDGEKRRWMKELLMSSMSNEMLDKYIPLMDQLAIKMLQEWSWKSKSQNVKLTDLAWDFGATNGFRLLFSQQLNATTDHRIEWLRTFFWGLTNSAPIPLPWTAFGKVFGVLSDLWNLWIQNSKVHHISFLNSTNECISDSRKCEFDDGLMSIFRKAKEMGKLNEISDEQIGYDLHGFMVSFGASFSAIANPLMLISQNHQINSKVKQEALKIPIDFKPNSQEELNSISKYLKQSIYESLRLSPGVIAGGFGRVIRDFQIEFDEENSIDQTQQQQHQSKKQKKVMIVKEGWSAIPSITGTNLDPNLWPDPTNFDPSRFEGIENIHKYSYHHHHHNKNNSSTENSNATSSTTTNQNLPSDKNFRLLSFGGGPATFHKCIGYQFSPLMAQVLISRMYRHCEWEMKDPNEYFDSSSVPSPHKKLETNFFSCNF